MSYSYQELVKQFSLHAEDEYREFAERITLSKRPVLGVRIPLIRKVVNAVPRESYEELLSTRPVTIEEVLARGMIIGKLPYEEMLKWKQEYAPKYALFLKGARCVGNTTLAEKLDREEYRS